MAVQRDINDANLPSTKEVYRVAIVKYNTETSNRSKKYRAQSSGRQGQFAINRTNELQTADKVIWASGRLRRRWIN